MRLPAAAVLCALAGCLDAPPTSQEGPAPDCGTVSVLEDEFDGAALDDELWGHTGGASADGGEARIVSGAGVYNTFYSAARYQVSGGQLVAELDVSQLEDALMFMELESSDQARIAITLLNGDLGLRLVDEAGERILDTASLGADHVWWRLREEAGEFFWALSLEGETWTERGPFAASIGELARVDFELLPNAQASTLIVNAVNPGMGGVYCPADSFQDDFASLSARWLVDEQGDCQITVDGQAELGYSAQAFCAMTTFERFDLRDSAYAVELADVGDCVPEPVIQVKLGDARTFDLLCDDDAGSRKLIARSDGGGIANIDFDTAKHRFVRVRHDGREKVLAFEASRGDGTWSPVGVAQMDDPQPLAHTSLRFYLGGDTNGGFESVAFDSLNTAP